MTLEARRPDTTRRRTRASRRTPRRSSPATRRRARRCCRCCTWCSRRTGTSAARRHRVLRRAARPSRPPRSPRSRPSTPSTSGTRTARTPWGSAPTPCARSWAATRSSTSCSEHLGVGHDETTEDGAITLERVECNAACDYAPVVMVNWEFFDNQTPAKATDLADRLRRGRGRRPDARRRVGVHVQADEPRAGRVLRRPRGRGRRGGGARRSPGSAWPASTTGPRRTGRPRNRPTSRPPGRRPSRPQPRAGRPPRAPPPSGGSSPPPSASPPRPPTPRAPRPTPRRGSSRERADDRPADPDPQRDLGRRALLDARRHTSRRAAARASRRPSRSRPRTSCRSSRTRACAAAAAQGFPTGMKWGFLPAPDGGPALPRRQRRRVRARHLQGHPAHAREPAAPDRGRGHHVLRDRLRPRVHLRARRGPARLPPAAARRRGGVRGRATWARTSRARASTSTSRCTRGRARTSAARRPRCSTRSRGCAASRGSSPRSPRSRACTRGPPWSTTSSPSRRVPAIVDEGADWFRSMGTERSSGHGLFSLSGHVVRPGQYEAPLGITLRELLDMAGGDPWGQRAEVLDARRVVDADLHRRPPRRPARLRVGRRGGLDARHARPADLRRDHVRGAGREPVDRLLRARVVRQVHAVPRGHLLAQAGPAPHRGAARGTDERPRRCCSTLCDNILGRAFCALGDGATSPDHEQHRALPRGVRGAHHRPRLPVRPVEPPHCSPTRRRRAPQALTAGAH